MTLAAPARRPWNLIACDLDGTLVGKDARPHPRDVEALKAAHDAGIRVVICTGRSLPESRRILEAVGLEGPGVFISGAEIVETRDHRPLKRFWMDDALVDRLIARIGEQGMQVMMLGEDDETGHAQYYGTDHGPSHPAALAWLRHNRLEQRPWPVTGKRPPVLRVGVVVDSAHERPLSRLIASEFAGQVNHHGLHSPSYACHVVELFANTVSKWSAIQEVCRMLGVPDDTVVAIGDDYNDVPMLKAARLSFAMGTACEGVRAHAKRVTAPQAECGVAQVVEGLLGGAF
jgi:5-amino-6-(5-phospho-D-ribitylamino)uracil phosphatase